MEFQVLCRVYHQGIDALIVHHGMLLEYRPKYSLCSSGV